MLHFQVDRACFDEGEADTNFGLSNYNVAHCTALIICPVAIAYSMEQIIKSVCVCQCVSVLCPSVSTLTVAFLDRFSPKFLQT